MRRSSRHRTPARLHGDYESEPVDRFIETAAIPSNAHSNSLAVTEQSYFTRRRLRSWRTSVPLPMPCQKDDDPEEKLEKRVQELVELQTHSTIQNEENGELVELRYVNVNAFLAEDRVDTDASLFIQIDTDGNLRYFLLDGWTSVLLATQPVTSISTQLAPTPPLVSDDSNSYKKRKTRAHVLPPGSLSLIPFGQNEQVQWTKRIFNFIGKMRRVLGDRRISLPWGGSIIDSLIGVYITQNVSDTFSSKAFMNVAAKFPSPSPRQRCFSFARDPVLYFVSLDTSDQIPRRFLKQVKEGQVWKWWCDKQSSAACSEIRPSPDSPFALLFNELDKLQSDLNPLPNPDLLGYRPGEISLEWMRRLDCESVTELLTSNLEGFGEKSAACVTLLCFHWKSFPVDVNVARICARLGWIPLKSAESIEELDLYAPEVEVHKYLKARLSHFDFDTLYELHYLMITMGKVFCTKTNPRCSACPLRKRCEYACNGGKRFVKLVSIKRQKRSRSDKESSDKTMVEMKTPSKSDRRLRSAGTIFNTSPEEPPEKRTASMESISTPTPEAELHEDAFLTPAPKTSNDDHLVTVLQPTVNQTAIQDIEDLFTGTRPRQPHDSVGSFKRFQHPSKPGIAPTPAASAPTSEIEIQRILQISHDFEASIKSTGSPEIIEESPTLPMSQEASLQILKVSAIDKEDLIRTQYRQLSKLIHPDKCKHSLASVAFSFLSQAYRTLVNNPDGSGWSSSELVEDETTESFVVSRMPLAIRTPLTFTRSRNILHAFHFSNCSRLKPFLPSHLSCINDFEVFLLPDPSGTLSRGEGDADECANVFLLITAKNAMASRFPLNGTFFQTNELFVIDDVSFPVHTSLLCPTDNPTADVSIVRVYFGTSVSRITLGMGTAEVTHLFNRSYICVRNFNFHTKQSSKLNPVLSP